jgi:DNA-binding IclR family transcriptional regulator
MTRLSNPTLRVTSVLDYLVAHPDRTVRLSTLSRNLGINKATCLAILRALVLTGYASEVDSTKEYSIGPGFLAGQAVTRSYWRGLERAGETSRRLSSELGVCADVHVRVGGHLTIVERHGPVPGPLQPVIRVGVRKPFVAPLGVSFIAWSTPEQYRQWLAPWLRDSSLAGSFGVSDVDAMVKRMDRCIEACRSRGFSIEKVTAGLRKFQDAAASQAERPHYEEFAQMALEILTSPGMEDYAQIDVNDRELIEISSITSPIVTDQGANLAVSLVGFDRSLTGRQVKVLGGRLAAETRRISAEAGGGLFHADGDLGRGDHCITESTSPGTRRRSRRSSASIDPVSGRAEPEETS